MVRWCSRQQIDSAVAGMKSSRRIRPLGEKERDGFFLKASPKLNERWKWERHNGSQTMYHLTVFFFFPSQMKSHLFSHRQLATLFCAVWKEKPRTGRQSTPSSLPLLYLRFSIWCAVKGTFRQLGFRQYETEVTMRPLRSQRCGDHADVGCWGITSANGV